MTGSDRVPSALKSQRQAVILRSWIFPFSRFLGLWPFDSDGNFLKTAFPRGVVAVCLPICVFSYTRTIAFKRILKSTEEDAGRNLTRHVLGFSIEIVMFLGCAVHAWVVCFRRESIKSIIKCLAQTKIDPTAFNFFFAVILSAQFIICYSAYVSFSIVSLIAQIGSINLIFVATMNYILILQFSVISIGLQKMMRLETASLRGQIVLDRQAALLETCSTANSIYHIQILLTLIQIFGYLVTYFYNLILDLIHNEDFFEYVLFLFMNVTVRCCILLLIANCSERLKIEADAFNAKLFKVMLTSNELCRNKKLKLFVTVKRSVNFTACGFFDLGYPLVTSIIAAATTYLVILIQFTVEK